MVKGEIEISWVATSEQLADIMTKVLPKSKFDHFVGQLLGME